jgi:hypothetical protein
MPIGKVISNIAHSFYPTDPVKPLLQELAPPNPIYPPDPITPANALGLAASEFVHAGELADLVQLLIKDNGFGDTDLLA